MKYIIQHFPTKRFIDNSIGSGRGSLTLAATKATKWDTLNQAIDFLLAHELPDTFDVVCFDTMRIEFSRRLPT